jgi:hypothetical protein
MIQTLFLLGPSDTEAQNSKQKITPEKGGVRVTEELTGVLPILPYVMNDPTLCVTSSQVIVGVHSIRLQKNARCNLFNLVGDADSSGNMLLKIQNIGNEIQPRRFFNQPSRVFRTSRGRLPATLANISGCLVPRTETYDPHTFSELLAACQKFGVWPMIVRSRGDHGGQKMLLLSELDQLESVKDMEWLYSGICIVEFIDYKNEDGLYQKNRVIMIDGTAYPRHSIFSDKWIIHAGSRAELMNMDLELCHREERLLAEFRDTGMGKYARIFDEIQARIGLDVFGVDFAIVDGEIVIFEANACMNFLDRRFRDNDRYQYMDSHVNALKRAIKKLLLRS